MLGIYIVKASSFHLRIFIADHLFKSSKSRNLLSLALLFCWVSTKKLRKNQGCLYHIGKFKKTEIFWINWIFKHKQQWSVRAIYRGSNCRRCKQGRKIPSFTRFRVSSCSLLWTNAWSWASEKCKQTDWFRYQS